MTYSPDHGTDGQQLVRLLDFLTSDLAEMEQLLSVAEEIRLLPGCRPDVDPDETGRRATAGPSRPTEQAALDEARLLVAHELNTGTAHLIQAIALVRGTTAALDRAISRWEGEPVTMDGGADYAGTDWPTGVESAARGAV
ncbi:DUF7169 domain-containing protein [Streptomyces sioyaensis]